MLPGQARPGNWQNNWHRRARHVKVQRLCNRQPQSQHVASRCSHSHARAAADEVADRLVLLEAAAARLLFGFDLSYRCGASAATATISPKFSAEIKLAMMRGASGGYFHMTIVGCAQGRSWW